MTSKKSVLSVRLPRNLESALRAEASKRGVAYSTIVEQAIEREIYVHDDEPVSSKLELLRSVLMIRELLLDMSPRARDEKDKLWKAIGDEAQKLLQSSSPAPSC